jgi:RING finger protein 170
LAFALLIIYIILPIDFIPEALFGLLGMADDIIMIGFVVVYLSTIYRSVMVNSHRTSRSNIPGSRW